MSHWDSNICRMDLEDRSWGRSLKSTVTKIEWELREWFLEAWWNHTVKHEVNWCLNLWSLKKRTQLIFKNQLLLFFIVRIYSFILIEFLAIAEVYTAQKFFKMCGKSLYKIEDKIRWTVLWEQISCLSISIFC